jgi:hypothetical protein
VFERDWQLLRHLVFSMEIEFAGLNFLKVFCGLVGLLVPKLPKVSVLLGFLDIVDCEGNGDFIPGLGVNDLVNDFDVAGLLDVFVMRVVLEIVLEFLTDPSRIC